MKRLLCFLGFHNWKIFNNKYVPSRECKRCGKTQFADLQESKWHEVGK